MSPAVQLRLPNHTIVGDLREAADLLEQQGASPFRTGAYRRAADLIERLDEPLADLLGREGPAALRALPGVGPGISAAVEEIVRTGRWGRLERMRAGSDPEALLRSVPGVGPALARRIHETLGVGTLEELEVAAHDGRLERVEGVGRRRALGARAALAGLLGRERPSGPAAADGGDEPPVDLLLDVDRLYRERAAAGALRTIAPQRFNPSGEAWLPVMHARRGPWHLTALFSNTARAHELGTTRDWVVLYLHRGDGRERQCTVVTAAGGPLAGRRVVRGREAECGGRDAA
jgi:hypothetical protein